LNVAGHGDTHGEIAHRGVGMRLKQKLLTGAVFALLVVAGGLTAGAVAGMGPLVALQTTTTTTVATTTTETTTTTTPAPPRRIRICHHARNRRTGAVRHVTIQIARSVWRAHRRHGDSLGACTTRANKRFHSRPAHVNRFHKRR
jgi:hypothetical protein